VGRAANNNLPLLVENTALDPSWLPNNLLPETRAEVAVPIAVGEQVLGVLDVQQNWVGGLGQLDVDLLQSLANQVAVTLQNARAFVSLQQQARREALVAAVNQKIQRTTTVEEALQVAVSELGQALSAKSARIELRSQQAPDRTSH
jgi:GAF domain-containing protein